MGPILAILSYVTRSYKKIISLMQKDTYPAYEADFHSNEAIRGALDIGVNNLTTIITNIKNNTFSVTRHSDLRTLSSVTQTVYENSNTSEPFIFHGGVIDFSPLLAGDKVYVTLYANISSSSYSVIGSISLNGPLDSANNTIEFSPMYNQYGVKVTIMQSAGTYRQIRSEWFDSKQLG